MVSADASDGSSGTGIDKVEFYYDANKPIGTATSTATTPPYSVTWDTTGLTDGEHTLKAKAFDKAGNSATSDDYGVVVKVNTYNTPVLTVEPNSIGFDPNQTSKIFTIRNTGASCSTLTWSIAIDPIEARQWLSSVQAAGTTKGTEATPITLNVTRGELKKGQYSGKVTVNSDGGTKEITVSMTVGNHCPVITSTCSGSASVGTAYTCDVEATDPDGDTLTYSLTTKPDGMTINSDEQDATEPSSMYINIANKDVQIKK